MYLDWATLFASAKISFKGERNSENDGYLYWIIYQHDKGHVSN